MGSGGSNAQGPHQPTPTDGGGWFGSGGPDFADYRGESLWQNPYEPRTPLDWARAEYGQFKHGPDPNQNWSQTLALAKQAQPEGAKAYGDWIQAREDINKMFFGQFPNRPYWAKFINAPSGLPKNRFSLPRYPTFPSPTTDSDGNDMGGDAGAGGAGDAGGKDGGIGHGKGGTATV